MSVLIKETQGDTLVGAIDGVNADYQTTFAFIVDAVNIYVNGLLKVQAWADGFLVIPPNTVQLKIPLTVGDSLEVEYQSNITTGGGADGGCPLPPTIEYLEITTQTDESIPLTAADDDVPVLTVHGEPVPVTLTDELVPVMLPPEPEDPCP